MLVAFAAVVVAMLALAGAAGAVVISNSSPISIPDRGRATPYPASINVSGLSGTTTDVNVTLHGVRHTWPDDVSALLVDPRGQKVMLMSDVGGGADLNGIDLTLDDEAAGKLPDGTRITTGAYKPTQGTGGGSAGNGRPANLPSPAPTGPYGTSLSAFDGADPNGTYELYVFDDTANDAGQVASGFSLDIRTSADPPPALLYPDLKTLPPTDLRFDTAIINGSTHRVLRFSNTAWNAGEGRLHLQAKTVDTTSGKKTRVDQRIYYGTAPTDPYTTQFAGKFVYHASHDHFHFGNFADYELWTKADYDSGQGQAQWRGKKTTFCIMDTAMVQSLPGSPSSAYYSTCGKIRQGLSIGWGDTYTYDLPDQWIDLGTTRLPDGEYVLRSVADPKNRIYESADKSDANRESPEDNAAITRFKVQGGTITITN